MPSTSKSTKKAAAVASPEFVDAVTPLVLNSVERVADLQKKTLDLAAEQSAELIGAWKKAFSYFPVTPPAFFFDFAGQAVQTAIESQKSAIDLVVEQTHTVTGINKVRAEAYAKIADGVTTSIQKSVGRSVEAQMKVLEFASAQTKAGFESAKKQLGAASGPATAVLDTFQLGADTVIEAQKSFLNMASHPFVTSSRN
jgi:hypothetical protein